MCELIKICNNLLFVYSVILCFAMLAPLPVAKVVQVNSNSKTWWFVYVIVIQ